MNEQDHGRDQPHPPYADPFYRIVAQAHDHEARIRLLEHDSVMLIESVKQIRSSIGDLGESLEKSQSSVETKLTTIETRLSEHVIEESRNLKGLFVSAVVQFLVVVAGFLFLIIESRL